MKPRPSLALLLLCLLPTWPVCSQEGTGTAPAGSAEAAPRATPEAARYLLGGREGLAMVTTGEAEASATPLLRGAEVRAILPSDAGFFLLTREGPVYSPDLASFEPRNAGLPRKLNLVAEAGVFAPRDMPVELKGLAVDPRLNGRLAAVTASEAWISEDWGRTWRSLGSPTAVPSYKAVSFGPLPGKSGLGVWVSNSIKGPFYRDFEARGPWISASAGLPKAGGSDPEEVAGFALASDGGGGWRFAAGLSFLGSLYEWDPSRAGFVERYTDGRDSGYVEALAPSGSSAFSALSGGGICRFSLEGRNGRWAAEPREEATEGLRRAAALALGLVGEPLCAAKLDGGPSGAGAALVANEFWRLQAPQPGPRARLATGKRALYLQTSFVLDPKGRAKYFDLLRRLGLDALVVDLKDDDGRLRFIPESSLLKAEGTMGAPLDIDSFAAEARERGIYLIGRIVVFKDKSLHLWKGGALAVQDSSKGGPWRGLKKDGSLIDEFWVDPYSPEVWRYNAEIGREAAARGFDEVQFDYIRFPTDGTNLGSASFPAKIPGMTEEGALESFLRFARFVVEAPLSVDIYGSNGWYRSGSRTGQDLEMLAEHVDAVCPMFYPSHFEQGFQAQAPAELRPYRIYRLGTVRAQAIARGKIVVRPYVQSFFLNVSYDRQYYGPKYVQDEVKGVMEGANQGMTFWNNTGRYDEVPSFR